MKFQERSLLEGGVGRSRQPGRRASARVPYDVFGSSSPAARRLNPFLRSREQVNGVTKEFSRPVDKVIPIIFDLNELRENQRQLQLSLDG